MDFWKVIQSRKSIRSFSNKTIPADILTKILEAGRLAPSCQNRQCWHYVIVKKDKLRRSLALKSGLISKINFFIKEAPIIIVACANPKQSCVLNKQDYYLVDTAISFQQMMLTAWNYGIGSCWLAAFNEEKVKKILNIPSKIRIVGLSPFGYPKEKKSLYAKTVGTFAGSNKRKKVTKIISYNSWNNNNPEET